MTDAADTAAKPNDSVPDRDTTQERRDKAAAAYRQEMRMSLCSAHQTPEPGCRLCQADPRDIFPDWDKKIAEAEAAGRHTCECGFVYFKTVTACPLCYRALTASTSHKAGTQ